MKSIYIIVFPRGDRSSLSIAEIDTTILEEKDDYIIASRKDFDELSEAHQYAIELSKKHQLTYCPPSYYKEANYLD